MLATLGRAFVLVPAAVSIYAIALHWTYKEVVQPNFAYMGQRYEPAEFGLVVLTLLIAVAVCLTLPRRLERPSSVILWILFVVTIAPTILMSTYLGIVPPGEAVVMSFGFGVAFALVSLFVRRLDPPRPLIKRISTTSFWLIIGLFSALVYVYLALVAGLSLRFLSIFDVYDVREDYAEVLSGAGLLGYLVSTQANVVNPLVMSRGIYTRNWALFTVGVLGQLILYSGTGFKTILFSIPALLIVALVFRTNARPRPLTLMWGASGVILVSAAIDSMQQSIVWSSLFARRFLITPAGLTSRYYEFYSNTEFEMLSHSILRPFFVHPPHEYGPARMIGVLISGSTSLSANANLFADGFAHFGWAGVAAIATLLTIFLRIVDRAAVGLPTAAAALVVVMPSIAVSNTSMLTAMFSHGLVAMVVLLIVTPRSGWSTRREAAGIQPSPFRYAAVRGN